MNERLRNLRRPNQLYGLAGREPSSLLVEAQKHLQVIEQMKRQGMIKASEAELLSSKIKVAIDKAKVEMAEKQQ